MDDHVKMIRARRVAEHGGATARQGGERAAARTRGKAADPQRCC
jgi:hypothetical protein